MLNGIDPIILFNFKKLPPSVESLLGGVPILASIVKAIDLPVVPLYLSENITGIMVDTESKSIEIDTTIDTLSTGGEPQTNQRGIQNTVKIEMLAKRNSLGVALFSALSDLIFPRVTSKEYSVTYLHGAVTVFSGLLHSFSISQQSGTELYQISLELLKPAASLKSTVPVVAPVTGAVPL